MLFSSTTFLLLFLPMILILYYNPWIKTRSYKNTVLLVGSIFFYAWGEPIFIFIMMISVLLNWWAGLYIEKCAGLSLFYRKKVVFILLIIYNLSLLFVFKYLSFFLYNAGLLLKREMSVEIALPIGISFFTFQILSYCIDVYSGKVKAQRSVYKLALYIIMFPQLIAGPIVRYSVIQDEIDYRIENIENFGVGMVRFIYGLGKKALLANYMGILADNMFYMSTNGELAICSAWLGAISYTLQIYYDFSGYSDMAIGLGRMFGFHYEENFNYPYIARNITEFWRRWHISLSEWFRDYVYIPLGGNQVSFGRSIFNLLIVWILTGLWHGANWTFVVWGIGYFILLVFEKIWNRYFKEYQGSHLVTMFWVIIMWVIFRADNVGNAVDYLSEMFGGSKCFFDSTTVLYLKNSWLVMVVALIFVLPVKKYVLRSRYVKLKNALYAGMAFPLLLVCISKCIASSYNPFIYFNF